MAAGADALPGGVLTLVGVAALPGELVGQVGLGHGGLQLHGGALGQGFLVQEEEVQAAGEGFRGLFGLLDFLGLLDLLDFLGLFDLLDFLGLLGFRDLPGHGLHQVGGGGDGLLLGLDVGDHPGQHQQGHHQGNGLLHQWYLLVSGAFAVGRWLSSACDLIISIPGNTDGNMRYRWKIF